MTFRLKKKNENFYYRPYSAMKYIDADVGKVYKSVESIKRYVVSEFTTDEINNWEIVEFDSERANGEVISMD